jgi:hypothetical protein
LGFFGGLYVYGGGLDHPLLFAGGLRWQSLAAALFEQYFGLALTWACWDISAVGQPPLASLVGAPTFWVYGLHAPLLVACGCYCAGGRSLHWSPLVSPA